jgi:hypothetical protein
LPRKGESFPLWGVRFAAQDLGLHLESCYRCGILDRKFGMGGSASVRHTCPQKGRVRGEGRADHVHRTCQVLAPWDKFRHHSDPRGNRIRRSQNCERTNTELTGHGKRKNSSSLISEEELGKIAGNSLGDLKLRGVAFRLFFSGTTIFGNILRVMRI